MTDQPRTTPSALIRAAEEFGELAAIADGDTRLTFAQLHQRVRDFAGALITRGVKAGDRVVIWAPNTHHWVIALLGAQYAGAAIIPINTRYTGTEALDIIERVDPAALVIVGHFLKADRYQQLLDADPDLSIPTVIRVPVDGDDARDGVIEFEDFLALATDATRNEADTRAVAVTPDDISDILFTSGTTGRSKGAISAHRQSIGVAQAWGENAEVTADDNFLIISPFFHTFGYKAGILVCLLNGATIVPVSVFNIDETLSLINREKVSILPGAPTIYQTILDHPRRGEYDLSSLRIAITGAAPVPVALVERMQSELFDAVLTAYGLTEAVVATMCRTDDDPVTVSTSSGRATADFEVKIGDQGEILLRGPNVMLGYLDDPDRLKDMYVSGGFNVYPAEIEGMLARLPGVHEAAAIGIPDHRMGEVGRVYIAQLDGAGLTEESVIAFLTEKIAGFKVPREVRFIDHLPRNPSGKILKTVLREEKA